MTRYIDYIEDISKIELYDGLVGHGLFTSKIPNFLTSEDFLTYSKNPRYWLYIYEVLSLADLTNEYKNMKRNGVTFIKAGF